jgi:hypothetical protein
VFHFSDNSSGDDLDHQIVFGDLDLINQLECLGKTALKKGSLRIPAKKR